jgi:hypothetical protein
MKLTPTFNNHEIIWVIVDRLISTHFIPIKEIDKMERLNSSIIKRSRLKTWSVNFYHSDRDGRLTSEFWKSLHKSFGTRLIISTAYHPQTEGQSKRTIQTLEDMMCAYALDYEIIEINTYL